MPRPDPAAVDTLSLATRMAVVEAELKYLRNTVTRIATTSSRRPPVDDLRFLTAVAAAVQDHVFSARELLNHTTVDVTLRAAVGDATAKQIGKRLRRLAGQSIGPYRVLWVDRDGGGNLWRLEVR